MRAFYEALGFRWDATNAPQLYAAKLADQKLNFHDPVLWENPRFTLRGPHAQPGCGDFCFVWKDQLDTLMDLLSTNQIEIELGPVERVGGAGMGRSIYVRDPDNNLIEFINYDTRP